MKKVLFATTNKQKIKRLELLMPMSLMSLSDLSYKIEKPIEVGSDALDIAIFKARHYWNALKKKMPVLTQDDSIKLEVSVKDSPGNYIKAPVVEKYGEFTDKNAIKYYTDLAKKYGGTIPMYFEYGHALCFRDKELIIVARKSKLRGRLVSKALENKSTEGYFLSAILQVIVDNQWKYYSELNKDQLIVVDSGITESLNIIFKQINE